MDLRRFGLLLGLVALAWPAGSAAADDAAVHQELQAIYDQAIEAVKQKDLGALRGHLAPGFSERDAFGKRYTLQTAEARLKKNLESTESIESVKLLVKRVVTQGNFAVALVTRQIAATIKGSDGKPHKLDDMGMSLHLWVKTADGWKLRFVDQLSLAQKIDGKPLQKPKQRQK